MKRVLERSQTCVVATSPSLDRLRARCKVAGKLVAEAELKFTLVDA